MANIITCPECGRMFDWSNGSTGQGGVTRYCSDGCKRKGDAAKATSQAESVERMGRALKLIGIILVALVGLITILCYKFPKFLKEKNKKFLYAYIITWVVLIAGTVVYFSFFSPEAVSRVKIKVVSTSCGTEDEFVSIVKKAISGLSVTVLEGKDFTTYSQQAYNAVIKIEGEFKDAVYFVRLPDSVNAYLWFKTKDQVTPFVYKIKKTK
jgi:hypothetical protein